MENENQFINLSGRVDILRQDFDKFKDEHNHDGNTGQLVNLQDVFGLIETVDTAPTHTPSNIYEQFKVYTNSTTYRFYWYDADNNVWHYVTATA